MPAPKDPIKYKEWKEKIKKNNFRKGKKFIFFEEHRQNLSKANKGQIPWIKGKKQTSEHIKRRVMSRIKNGTDVKHTAPRGENHYLYIKDRSKLAKRQKRSDVAYKEWRKNVWIRDKYKCRMKNNDCKGRIEVHHILSWSKFPELRYEIKNGITLCQYHHPRKKDDETRMVPILKELTTRQVD